jgi:hypothetical protein
MEAIIELLVALIAWLVELTIWAIVGLFIAVRAVFSQRHRERLKHEWNSRWKGKVTIMFSFMIWTSVIATAE